jgi:hypothetical protein
MSSGVYRFTRTIQTPNGFLSRNDVCTDALNAVQIWANSNSERALEVLAETDAHLEVRITWTEPADQARDALDALCDRYGVVRTAVGG